MFMDNVDDDDLAAVLEELEGDKDIETEVNSFVQNSIKNNHKCGLCGKIYKTISGVRKHIKKIHQAVNEKTQDVLTTDILLTALTDAQYYIIENKTYPEKMIENIKNYKFDNNNIVKLKESIASTCEKLVKFGDIEEFYSKMYGDKMLCAGEFFPALHRDEATLIMKRLIDSLVSVVHHNKHSFTNDISKEKETPKDNIELTENEKHGLKYIGGFVCRQLTKKLKNSKSWNVDSVQMALSFLKATRNDDENNDDNTIMNNINRGGLWIITENTESVFLVTEKNFEKLTKNNPRNINNMLIIEETMKNPTVCSFIEYNIEIADLKIDKSVAEDTMLNMISLYVKVRCFAKVRSILEKIKSDTNKSGNLKGLRKDLKKRSSKSS